MTAIEAIGIYEGLIDLLHKMELGWIADEVESVLASGKMEAFELEQSQKGRRGRGKELLGHSHRPWTEEERLAILLDGIEAALCGPALLTDDLVTTFPELGNGVLEFAPDEEEPQDQGIRERLLELARRSPVRAAHSIRLDEGVSVRVRYARKLSELLSRVREELDANLT